MQQQFARISEYSEYHIFAPPNAAPFSVPPGADAPFITTNHHEFIKH